MYSCVFPGRSGLPGGTRIGRTRIGRAAARARGAVAQHPVHEQERPVGHRGPEEAGRGEARREERLAAQLHLEPGPPLRSIFSVFFIG